MDSGPQGRRRGLVIGAGAALGGAWSLGALCALEEVEGYRPADVDIIVGTSAGSVLAALLGLGLTPTALIERLAGSLPRDVADTAPVNPFDVHDYVDEALGTIPRPGLRPSSLRLAGRAARRPHRHTLLTAAAALAPRGRGDLAPLHDFIADEARGRDWPVEPEVWITAMEQPSGRRVVFGRDGTAPVDLADAVIASCAAPGYFPPVRIGDREYVDGGAVSITNADVVRRADLDEVVVLAPMAMYEPAPADGLIGWFEHRLRGHVTRRLDEEVARLIRAGVAVRVLAPTAEDLAVMGHNVMDPRRRLAVLETALVTTQRRLRADPPLVTTSRRTSA